MKLEFLLYSNLIQEEHQSTELYKQTVTNGSLLKIDEYNNEVYISKITNELIIATINSHIKDTAPENYEDELLPLNGGLRIEHDDKIIEHQCCSELNDYHNWEDIITLESATWKEIWIGHPSIYYRIIDGRLELSEYYDANPDQSEIQTKMTFNKTEFIEKLNLELRQLHLFKDKVYRIIDQGDYENKEALKNLLIK